MNSERSETVGDFIQAASAQWEFGEKTAEYFDQHVQRSVPFYHECHELALRLSDYFVMEQSVVYDLGAATGVLPEKLARRHEAKDCQIIGVDAEEAMVKRAQARCADYKRIEIRHGNVMDLEWQPTDFVTCFYTLQFIRPKVRQHLVNLIYQNLNWGGAFLLFEKVRGPDARFQDMMNALYTDYKLANGYSGDEIVQKTRSLKGVLEPFSTQGNLDLFKRAGFVDVMTVYKYVCFEGFLAIK
ncbi:MAG: methyltransferase domain-containing protein [Verrucomicrobiota bacterium]